MLGKISSSLIVLIRIREDVDELLQQFWGLIPEQNISVDDLVQQLSEIWDKIFLINNNETPSESSMKNQILSHFFKCCGSFYMSTVITLKDPNVPFLSAVASLHESQAVYQDLYPSGLVNMIDSSPKSASNRVKYCAHCKRRGHTRETLFSMD